MPAGFSPRASTASASRKRWLRAWSEHRLVRALGDDCDLAAQLTFNGTRLSVVMPGLVPGIHVLLHFFKKGVDGRDKPGHDVDRCVDHSKFGINTDSDPA